LYVLHKYRCHFGIFDILNCLIMSEIIAKDNTPSYYDIPSESTNNKIINILNQEFLTVKLIGKQEDTILIQVTIINIDNERIVYDLYLLPSKYIVWYCISTKMIFPVQFRNIVLEKISVKLEELFADSSATFSCEYLPLNET